MEKPLVSKGAKAGIGKREEEKNKKEWQVDIADRLDQLFHFYGGPQDPEKK